MTIDKNIVDLLIAPCIDDIGSAEEKLRCGDTFLLNIMSLAFYEQYPPLGFAVLEHRRDVLVAKQFFIEIFPLFQNNSALTLFQFFQNK